MVKPGTRARMTLAKLYHPRPNVSTVQEDFAFIVEEWTF